MNSNQVPLLAKNVHARLMRHLFMLLINPYGSPDQSDNWWWEQNPYQAKSLRFSEQTKHNSIANHAFHSIREIQFDYD